MKGSLSTLTHARLRASQGDHGAARRILTELLARDPDDAEARRMLDGLSEGPAWQGPGEREELAPEAVPARAADLAGRFKKALGASRGRSRRKAVERLEAWLTRARRNANA